MISVSFPAIRRAFGLPGRDDIVREYKERLPAAPPRQSTARKDDSKSGIKSVSIPG
jgi:hypothetical protein